jgi:hypothetical protein
MERKEQSLIQSRYFQVVAYKRIDDAISRSAGHKREEISVASSACFILSCQTTIRSLLMASSSTATMVGLRKPSKATALLVLSTTGPHSPFAADTDGAEKGISGPAYKLIDMKRVTTSKNSAPPQQTMDSETSQEAEQASSSGASRYPGLQRLVDNTYPLGEGNDINSSFYSPHPFCRQCVCISDKMISPSWSCTFNY